MLQLNSATPGERGVGGAAWPSIRLILTHHHAFIGTLHPSPIIPRLIFALIPCHPQASAAASPCAAASCPRTCPC